MVEFWCVARPNNHWRAGGLRLFFGWSTTWHKKSNYHQAICQKIEEAPFFRHFPPFPFISVLSFWSSLKVIRDPLCKAYTSFNSQVELTLQLLRLPLFKPPKSRWIVWNKGLNLSCLGIGWQCPSVTSHPFSFRLATSNSADGLRKLLVKMKQSTVNYYIFLNFPKMYYLLIPWVPAFKFRGSLPLIFCYFHIL